MRRLFLSVAALVLLAAPSRAEFLIDSVVADYDSPTQTMSWLITFNQAPDFTADVHNRHARDFQLYAGRRIPLTDYIENYAIVRGPEIPVSAPDLWIRKGTFAPDYDGSDPASTSGGWGFVRAAVPYSLVGGVLQFSATLAQLGLTEPPPDWRLETYEYGRTSDTYSSWNGHNIMVPEPSSFILVAMGAGLGLMAIPRRHASN